MVGSNYWSLFLPVELTPLREKKRCLAVGVSSKAGDDYYDDDFDATFGRLDTIGSVELQGINMNNKKVDRKIRAYFENKIFTTESYEIVSSVNFHS